MIVDHWIKANHTARVPRRWVTFDTEAKERREGDAAVQTWRLAVTAFDRCDTDSGRWIDTQWATHRDPESLWEWIDARTRRRARTVAVAHNLGYDLRVSRALTLLPTLGWSIDRFNVHERSCSITMRRGDRKLLLCDSMAWLPMPLAKIGGLVGEAKLDLPDMTDDDDDWEQRCHRDVAILRKALRTLIEWWDTGDLGNWQRTGAGQAWAHWRHAHYTHRVLVHSDETARTAEVEAMSAARCEAWRWGRLPKGTWEEWDLPLAYPHAAATTLLPVALHAESHVPSPGWIKRASKERRVLVQAVVTTDQPVLPLRCDNRTSWPVGTFEGKWWERELAAAEEVGATVRPVHAWSYRQAPALRSWGAWVIEAATDPVVTGSLVRMEAARHMSRALIGRFAAQWTDWVEWAELPFTAAPLEPILTRDQERKGRMLTLGPRSWVGWERHYGVDAVVAITSAIQAEVRVRLWEAMGVVGHDHLAYVDTDSLIVDAEGARRLRRWVDDGGGWGLRVKRRFSALTILGPRQLIVTTDTRVAGVPKGAVWLSERTMRGQVWESIESALAHGRPGEVVIRTQRFTLSASDHRRAHLPGGRTAALPVPTRADALRGA